MTKPSTDTDETQMLSAPERPAPPRPPLRSSSGFGRFLVGVMLLAATAAGAYATLPIWWPQVTTHLPFFELTPREDPQVANRLKALEDEAQARKKDGSVIYDLEAERARQGKELRALLDRLKIVEGAVVSVREIVAATALKAESVDVRQVLQRLSSRLEQIESAGGELPGMKARIRELEEKIVSNVAGALRNRAPQPNLGLAETIEDIAKRVGALEEVRPQGESTGAHSVVLAVGQLHEAVRRGGPFARALETFRMVGLATPKTADAVASLESYADAGVPTLETLRFSFGEMAKNVSTTAVAAQGEGWVDKAVTRLSSLVTVRKQGERAEDSAATPILKTAEAALERGDLNSAVLALEGLTGVHAAASSMWLAEARSRLVVDQALETLHNQAMTSIGPTGG